MSDETTPDGLLLRRYREDRDEAAFAELRRRHERLVFGVCRREIGDTTLAEDATQAAFLLLIRKSFADDASLAGWLHGAARLVSKNLLREEGRRQRRERRAFVETEEPDLAWEAVEPVVDAALAHLKAADREAVLLRFAGEKSLTEVGLALGIPENAARMRVSRALERMRSHIRRAGVAVPVALLATLLSTRLADAAPSLRKAPSTRALKAVRGGAWTLPMAALWKPVLGVVLGVGAIFFTANTLFPPPRLGSLQTKVFFARTVGTWHGTLDFADDATGVRTKTETSVEIDRRDGGLRMVARYPGFATADTTSFLPAGEGRFTIENVGSHRLDGAYDLVLLGGAPTFVGFSPAVRAEVRLSVRAAEGSLVVQEEVRRGGAYRLRNRFELVR